MHLVCIKKVRATYSLPLLHGLGLWQQLGSPSDPQVIAAQARHGKLGADAALQEGQSFRNPIPKPCKFTVKAVCNRIQSGQGDQVHYTGRQPRL